MARKIFINYRREDSVGTAGRLYDRLEQTFGRKNLFVDIVGVDLKARLNNQVAACQVFLAVISPNWLDAKDEAGLRRLHHPDDFVAIEIAAALARNIRVIPVLVDGARMPNVTWLPDSLKPLARRQAIEVRQLHFDRDAEALVERLREALNGGSVGLRSWRGTAAAGVAVAAGLLLVGWVGLHWMDISVWPPWAETREAGNAQAQAEAETKRKSAEAEQQRLATLSAAAEAETKRKSAEAEQQRLATLNAAAEAETKRKSAEAEQQRLATLNAAAEAETKRKSAEAEQQRLATLSAAAEAEAKRKSAEAEQQRLATLSAAEVETKRKSAEEAEAERKSEEAEQQRVAALRAEEERNERSRGASTYAALISQGTADSNAGDYDRAITHYNEAIRLDPKSAVAFMDRGDAYMNKGNNDRAIADYNEAIRTRSQERSRPQRPGRRLCTQRRHRPSHRRF